MVLRVSAPSPARPQPSLRPPKDLLLDPTNPRLAGHHFELEEQGEILAWLWKNKSVDELVGSMLASGFWPHEELFAVQEEGKLVVVEGNRRLAAVKILLDPALRQRLRIQIEEPSEWVRASLKLLPVFVQSRVDIWQFVGFKHVNGPQEWDSIAKAEYIHRVHQTYGVELREIARTIGDEHDTVRRLYRGYLVLKQAEIQTGFDPEDCYQRKFPFSHLWTALGYSNVQSFLGVDSERLEKPDPVPAEKLEALRSLMLWLFGSRREGRDPKVKRQNPDLRVLVQALENPKGVALLQADLPLSAAREATLGDERLFQDALLGAERGLREAKRFVATGYHGEEELLLASRNVETLAKSLYKEMSTVDTPVENE
jgi:hypothetical protein